MTLEPAYNPVYVEIAKLQNQLSFLSFGKPAARAQINLIKNSPLVQVALNNLLNRFQENKILILANATNLTAESLQEALLALNQVNRAPTPVYKNREICVQIERIL